MIDGDVLSIAALTIRVAAVATVAILPFSIGLGLAMARRDFPAKALLQALIALPMVLPPVAVGLGLLLLLGRDGPLSALWSMLGIELAFSWWAAVLAAGVVGFPLLTRACEQAFAEVDTRYEQVSRSLGLGALQTFRRVTFPLARRGVLYGTLLGFTRALGEFGATALVAGIIPGRTETLALGIYSRVQLGDDASALVLCGVSFAIALSAMFIGEQWLRRGPR